MSRPDSEFSASKYLDQALINSFLDNLEQRIKVKALIVFGSRAKGDALLTSDYDIAVVSDDFKGMKRFERTYLLLDVWAADLALEAVAYTEEEFMKATGMLVWDILEDGVAFKDKGVFRERKKLHDDLKAAGKLKKVEGGWAF